MPVEPDFVSVKLPRMSKTMLLTHSFSTGSEFLRLFFEEVFGANCGISFLYFPTEADLEERTR